MQRPPPANKQTNKKLNGNNGQIPRYWIFLNCSKLRFIAAGKKAFKINVNKMTLNCLFYFALFP